MDRSGREWFDERSAVDVDGKGERDDKEKRRESKRKSGRTVLARALDEWNGESIDGSTNGASS